MLLIISVIKKWHTQLVDFVMAYTQATIDHDHYMKPPKVIETKKGNGKTDIMKLIRIIILSETGGVDMEHITNQGSNHHWI